MTYLGYDPERLSSLRSAMRRAVDELDPLQTFEPEAADAMRVIRACRAAIDDLWDPLLGRLMSCSALIDQRPIQLDPTDLRSVLMLGAQRSGWEVVSDPLPGAALSTAMLVDEARAIAAGLLDPKVTAELTAGELTWLTSELQAIARRPAAIAALRDAFGGDSGWAVALNRLGLDRLDQQQALATDPHDRTADHRIDLLDAAMTALTTAYAAGPHTSHAPWYPSVIGQLDPYTGALVLSHLDLDPRTAASAAEGLVVRWLDGWQDGTIPPDQLVDGPNAVDILFGWLAEDEAAARQFLLRAAERPELLFSTAHDAAVSEVLIAGTRPGAPHPTEVGRILPALIDWAALHADVPAGPIGHGALDLQMLFAEALSPWLMQLTARSDEWAWQPGHADAALRWVIGEDAAAERLVASMDQVQSSISATPLVDGEGRLDVQALDDVATMFATLQLALRDEDASDALSQGAWLDVVRAVAQTAVTAVPKGRMIGTTVNVTVGALSPSFGKWLDDTISGRAAAKDEAQDMFGQRTADLQAAAVVAVVGQLIDNGSLPPDTLDRLDLDGTGEADCVPEAVDDQVHEFVLGLRDETDPASYNAVYAVSRAFANPQSIAEAC